MPQLQGRPLYSSRCPYRKEMIQRKMPAPQVHPAQPAQPVRSAWATNRTAPKQSTFTVHKHMSNKFQLLPQLPTLEDCPDTLMTSGRTAGLVQEVISTKLSPPTPVCLTPRTVLPGIPTSHSAKETIPLRGMDTSREEYSQQTTSRSNSPGDTNRQLSPRPGTSTVNQSSSIHSKATSYIHQNRTSGVPDEVRNKHDC